MGKIITPQCTPPKRKMPLRPSDPPKNFLPDRMQKERQKMSWASRPGCEGNTQSKGYKWICENIVWNIGARWGNPGWEVLAHFEEAPVCVGESFACAPHYGGAGICTQGFGGQRFRKYKIKSDCLEMAACNFQPHLVKELMVFAARKSPSEIVKRMLPEMADHQQSIIGRT